MKTRLTIVLVGVGFLVTALGGYLFGLYRAANISSHTFNAIVATFTGEPLLMMDEKSEDLRYVLEKRLDYNVFELRHSKPLKIDGNFLKAAFSWKDPSYSSLLEADEKILRDYVARHPKNGFELCYTNATGPYIPPGIQGQRLFEKLPKTDSSAPTVQQWIQETEQFLREHPETKWDHNLHYEILSFQTLDRLRSNPIDLKFTALDGREVDLATMRGKVVLFDFWATWCGPCVQNVPEVVEAYKKYHDKGFEIVGFSSDSDKAKLESFIKEKRMLWPEFFDGKASMGRNFGINGIPTLWLFNKQGILVEPDARGKLDAQIPQLLSE